MRQQLRLNIFTAMGSGFFFFLPETLNPTTFIIKVLYRETLIFMMGLSVGFLLAGTGTRTSKLFGFAAMGISYQQGPVVLDEDVFAGSGLIPGRGAKVPQAE